MGGGDRHRKSWFSILFLGFVLYIFTVRRDLFWDVVGVAKILQFLLGHYCVGILDHSPHFDIFFTFHFIQFSYLFIFINLM